MSRQQIKSPSGGPTHRPRLHRDTKLLLNTEDWFVYCTGSWPQFPVSSTNTGFSSMMEGKSHMWTWSRRMQMCDCKSVSLGLGQLGGQNITKPNWSFVNDIYQPHNKQLIIKNDLHINVLYKHYLGNEFSHIVYDCEPPEQSYQFWGYGKASPGRLSGAPESTSGGRLNKRVKMFIMSSKVAMKSSALSDWPVWSLWGAPR